MKIPEERTMIEAISERERSDRPMQSKRRGMMIGSWRYNRDRDTDIISERQAAQKTLRVIIISLSDKYM